MTPNTSRLAYLDRLSRFGQAVVICAGVVVLFGWALDIPVLKSIAPGFVSMKINTALAFIAAAVTLWLLRISQPKSKVRLVARILALALIVLSTLILAQDVLGFDGGIDQLFMRDVSGHIPIINPGRMSPITSVGFIVIGFVLSGLMSRRHQVAIAAHWLTLIPLFVAMLAMIGYLYDVHSLYQVKPFSSIALHTSVMFFILSLSICAADPAHGIGGILASDSAGGVILRWFLPTIPAFLIGVGWISLLVHNAGFIDTPFSLAVMVCLRIGICFIAIIFTAHALRRFDVTRKRAEGEVFELNVGLEKLLEERIKQIAQLSAALAANKSLEQDSLHDGLTSIPNRRFLDAYLVRQIAIARRHRRSLAFVLCDIDSFKKYNDHYGHRAGDECLKKVATAIRSCANRPADMAARYGGEEFALVLPDTDLAGAAEIAERARAAVAALDIPHAKSRAEPYVSISGGVSVMQWTIDMTEEELITAADQSLYQAKHEGRNRIIAKEAA